MPFDGSSLLIGETTYIAKGTVSGLTPDENGVFKNHPMAVVGSISRNKTLYLEDDFMNHVMDKSTMFNQHLRNGQLYGEWGHPNPADYPDKNAQLQRMARVDEKFQSHLITGLRVGKTLESGGKLIVGDIKPMGPYGKHLEDSLRSPVANTSFSLRAFTSNRDVQRAGQLISERKVTHMITFDAVLQGGFLEASKAFSEGHSLESQNMNVIEVGDCLMVQEISLESFTDSELNDVLGEKLVGVVRQRVVLADTSKVGGLEFKSDLKTFMKTL